MSGILAIGGGASHSIALKNNGTVYAWGHNTSRQLGDGTMQAKNYPVQVSGLSGVIAISCGANHSLALQSNSNLWAWGYNAFGSLGDGSTNTPFVPVQPINLCTITGIEKIKEELLLNIFPNPNNGKFIIEQKNNFERMSLEIYNAMGEKVLQYETQHPKSEIDLTSQPKGIYFAKSGDGIKTFTGKIIVQ